MPPARFVDAGRLLRAPTARTALRGGGTARSSVAVVVAAPLRATRTLQPDLDRARRKL